MLARCPPHEHRATARHQSTSQWIKLGGLLGRQADVWFVETLTAIPQCAVPARQNRKNQIKPRLITTSYCLRLGGSLREAMAPPACTSSLLHLCSALKHSHTKSLPFASRLHEDDSSMCCLTKRRHDQPCECSALALCPSTQKITFQEQCN